MAALAAPKIVFRAHPLADALAAPHRVVAHRGLPQSLFCHACVSSAPAAVASAVAVVAFFPRKGSRMKLQAHKTSASSEMEGALPSMDFSDPFAKVLKAGPPLRIAVNGGLQVDLNNSGVGSQVKWGLLKEEVPQDSIDQSSEAQERRRNLREAAATTLTNIDDPERERRGIAGRAFAVVATLVCIALVLSHAAWYTRFAAFPLIALANGYILSEQEGL